MAVHTNPPICPDCSSRELFSDRHEVSCRKCGSVIEENASAAPFAAKGAKISSVYTLKRHDRGIGSVMGSFSGLSAANRRRFARLRVRNTQASQSGKRTKVYGLSELNRIASALHIHKTACERAAYIFSRISYNTRSEGTIGRHSTEAVVGGIVYMVSKEHGTGTTINDIAEAAGVDKKRLLGAYMSVSRKIGMRIAPPGAESYVPGLCSKLGVDYGVRQKAIEIISMVRRDRDFDGLLPRGIAAAAVYIGALTGGLHLPQRGISSAIGVTEVTLRHTYEKMSKFYQR